jgi:hypothetical protein
MDMILKPTLSLLTVVASLTVTVAANAAMSFRTVSTTSLPPGVIARDVRWASANEVYLGAGKRGVVRTRVDSTVQAQFVVPGVDRGGVVIAGRVGVGQSHLFFASGMGVFGWAPLPGASGKVEQKALIAMMDIDARGDTAAILGADSGPLQGLEREGTILWLGSLSKSLADMRPVMKGRSKPGGKDMARCGVLETGAIRYMQDGSLVVVPGVEPGVYRYGADGKLLQTWDTEPLGIVDDCSIPENDLLLVARDFGERIKWYASRVIVDEVLPLPAGPALVLRRVEKGVTSWEIVTLPYKGRSERVALPLTMATPRAHIRGDVRDDQLLLLMWDDPLPGQQAVEPPKLIVLSMKDQ